MQGFFLVPGPPYFFMSRQLTHFRQLGVVHPRHLLHHCVLRSTCVRSCLWNPIEIYQNNGKLPSNQWILLIFHNEIGIITLPLAVVVTVTILRFLSDLLEGTMTFIGTLSSSFPGDGNTARGIPNTWNWQNCQ